MAAGALVLPVTAPAEAPPAFKHGDFMALNSRGKAPNTSSDSMRQVYEFDLYSLATGEKIGTAIDDTLLDRHAAAVPGIRRQDHLQASRRRVHQPRPGLGVFDPQRPGWVLVGSLPSSKGIIAGTGAYAGRTGKVTLAGVNNAASYPAELGVDDRWVIQFDPKS